MKAYVQGTLPIFSIQPTYILIHFSWCIIIIFWKMNLEKITLNEKRYTTISMDSFYPFGGIIETPEDDEGCLVMKKLCYQQEGDLKLLQQMADLVQSLDSDFLIKLVQMDASEPNTCILYYEYVPLIIDKWVLDMGEQLIKELHFQLLNLASFLSHKGFKFTFNPHCVGLSQDIKVKYFLNQFSIDKQNKLTNYKDNERIINNYFDELTSSDKKNFEQSTRQTISSNGVESSVFVRSSWDSRSWKSSGSGKGITQKKITAKVNLMERIQQTKKRSLDVIERLKASKIKLK